MLGVQGHWPTHTERLCSPLLLPLLKLQTDYNYKTENRHHLLQLLLLADWPISNSTSGIQVNGRKSRLCCEVRLELSGRV